jgi:hypothetical protein
LCFNYSFLSSGLIDQSIIVHHFIPTLAPILSQEKCSIEEWESAQRRSPTVVFVHRATYLFHTSTTPTVESLALLSCLNPH